MHHPRLRRRLIAVTALALMCAIAAPAWAISLAGRHGTQRRAHDTRPRLSILVLSGRPDLVSGEQALVSVQAPRARGLRITLNGRAVTARFRRQSDGTLEALLTGLRVGTNPVQVRLRTGWTARLVLTDHPNTGPLFSGPQLHPWVCEMGATDPSCDKPTTYTYEYRSTDPAKSGFQSYDPANPPTDVATTTTDNGQTVPFIVRVETGYMDRDQYQIAALYQPGKPWTPVAPQPQFDHKLLITHGASCGDDRQTGTAPATASDGAGPTALGKGFIVMSTALDNSGHNCILPLQAESLVMAKQHLITTYGTVRYTIGTGCSGGSLAEQWIANAYPGIYQGILPTCSFPDAWSTASQFLDYHLLIDYFTHPEKWAPGVVWTPSQINDVMGDPMFGFQNSQVSENAQFHVAVPTDPCAGTTAAERYDPATNPGGVRCTIADAAINVFGPEPSAFWGPSERKVGHGFVRDPVDNVGVEYGLSLLADGTITPAQFTSLNQAVGGIDIDTNATPGRLSSAGSPALARAYRSGMIDEANHLDQVPIIDCRGTNPGLFHDTYRAFAIRARLDRDFHTHANQVIWEGPVPLTADSACEVDSFEAMDTWLTRVEADHTGRALAAKIIADKPTDVTDECYSGQGQMLSHSLCPSTEVPVAGTPRTVAGDAITTDTNKCQLKPLVRSSFTQTFTDTEWAALQKAFPDGVCDYTKPGVDQQPTVAWMTYQDARGRVIYGGRPLGPVPTSREFHR